MMSSRSSCWLQAGSGHRRRRRQQPAHACVPALLAFFLSLSIYASFCPSVGLLLFRPPPCSPAAFFLLSHLGFVTRKFLFSFPRHCCRVALPCSSLLISSIYFSPTNAIACCRTYLALHISFSPLYGHARTVAKMLSCTDRQRCMAFRHANCAISIPVGKERPLFSPLICNFCLGFRHAGSRIHT